MYIRKKFEPKTEPEDRNLIERDSNRFAILKIG